MVVFPDSHIFRVSLGIASAAWPWRWLRTHIFNSYRPELHYMRGSGPKGRGKHANSGMRVSGSHPERMRTLFGVPNGGRTHAPVRLSINDVTQRRAELEPGLVKEVPGSGGWLAPA
jgi:hypothetical protein